MVLAHADRPPPRRVQVEVGVWEGRLGRNRPGVRAGLEAVDPLIGEVGECHYTVPHAEGAAAVFVGAGAHVERRGGEVRHGAVGGPAHEDRPSGLRGAGFKPVEAVPVGFQAAESHRPSVIKRAVMGLFQVP